MESSKIQAGDLVRLNRPQTIVTGQTFPAGKRFRVTKIIEMSNRELRANIRSETDGRRVYCIPLDRLEVVTAECSASDSDVAHEADLELAGTLPDWL